MHIASEHPLTAYQLFGWLYACTQHSIESAAGDQAAQRS